MPSLPNNLLTFIHQYGALSYSAVEGLAAIVMQHTYGRAKAVHLEAGSMVYVGEGLLKQYARAGRAEPDIVRFVQAEEVLLVPYEVDRIYIKTLEKSTLYMWDEYLLRQLINQHPELLKIYMQLRDMQEAILDFKLLLLGQEVRQKLDLFDQHYPGLRSRIKNKDLANYLHVHESTLSRSKR